MKTIIGKTKAYLSEYRGPEDLNGPDPKKVVGVVTYSQHDMTKHGYTLIGEAEITLSIIEDDEIVLNKIEALESSITSVQAEAEQKITRIREQIQNLKAITFKG